jgi:hypothetical protein
MGAATLGLVSAMGAVTLVLGSATGSVMGPATLVLGSVMGSVMGPATLVLGSATLVAAAGGFANAFDSSFGDVDVVKGAFLGWDLDRGLDRGLDVAKVGFGLFFMVIFLVRMMLIPNNVVRDYD